MPRKARFAPPGLFLHLTQRGNYRQRTYFTDQDRHYYLHLLERGSSEHQVTIAGFCLMSNHVHLLASGTCEGAISDFMKSVNGEYAFYLNSRLGRKGRLWQGRFYSCVLDESHLTTVLRYIERNPVRAALTASASEYRWSSAQAHLQQAAYPSWLDESAFRSRWTTAEWQSLLSERQAKGEVAAIRISTRRQHPMASESFIRDLEHEWNVSLSPKAPGRPRKAPGMALALAPISKAAC